MTLFKTWNLKFRYWTFTEIQSGTSLHLADPAASQHNGAFVFSDQIKVSFLKVSAPTSVCTKIPIVGWGRRTVCWTFQAERLQQWRCADNNLADPAVSGWGRSCTPAKRNLCLIVPLPPMGRCSALQYLLFNVVYLLLPSVCKGPYELFLQPTSRRH